VSPASDLRRAGATGWDRGLEAVTARLLPGPGGARPPGTVVAVQGPGGTGKTALLDALRRRCAEAGVAAVGPRTGDDLPERPGDAVVLVDDAHRIPAEDLAELRRLLRAPGARVVVAARPWPRPPALLQALEDAGGVHHTVLLGHLEPAAVARCAVDLLGYEPPTALVDFVVAQTGGLPALVHPLLASLTRALDRTGPGTLSARLAPGQPLRFELPQEVLDRVRSALAALDDDARSVLQAAAAGAPLDPGPLAAALEIGSRPATEALHRARSSGFLLTDGTVVPIVGAVLDTSTPRELSRALRRRLLALLVEQGEEPLALARALTADGVRDRHAAALLLRAGTEALATDPALAGALLAEAAAAGTPAAGVHSRQALAAALTGDFDGALRRADAVLRNDGGPPAEPAERSRAAGVAAAVVAQRGLLARSAELYRLAGSSRAGARALVLLATGARAEAEEALADAGRRTGEDPGLLGGAEELTARGILASVAASSGPEAMTSALSALTRAAALLEPLGGSVLLPDSPSALAALVALHNGELGIAESGLRRALAAGTGGRPARARHLLLLAWSAMLRGRIRAAREQIDRIPRDRPLEPRDELFLQTLEVGLARRSSDSLALVAAWERAREAVLRHPVDLFTLLPLGELVVAAARLREVDALAPHRSAAAELLGRLGNPPLWATSLQWSGVQAAILSGDPAGLGPHATALVTAARTHPFAATLARAGRSWLRVLNDDVDAPAVVLAAEGLAAAGLAWDGSRLAGQAAARAGEPRDRSSLLHCARTLAEDDGEPATAARPAPAVGRAVPPSPRPAEADCGGALSSREREVAELLLAGQTYREVGSRLFISAKTVEHHVARMRQRLGATTRSDLLARLRAELVEAS
jgi:DNA-binding CsgD family transcriptional regulator